MGAHYALSSVLGVRDTEGNKMDKDLCPCGISFPVREAVN